MEPQPEQLAVIVQQMAETVIAGSDMVEQLSDRMDDLATQMQQQGSQITALTDAVQILTDNQNTLVVHIAQLTETLSRIAASLETEGDASF